MDGCALLADANGPRVVGMWNRARNERVLARCGIAVIDAAQAARIAPDRPLLVLRETIAVNVAFCAALPAPDAAPRLIGPAGGPFALYGRARDVRPLLGRYFAGERLCASAGLTPIEVPDTLALSLATGRDARRATWRLLRQAEKPTDGIVSRHLNRPLSRCFSRLFLALGLSPDHASFVSLSIGLACAWFAAQPGALTLMVAGALFQFASAFDGVDGEMARATLRESPRGAWIDTAVDNVTYVACLIGVSLGWAREGIGPAGSWLAGAVLVAVPATLLMLLRFVRRFGTDGSLVFVDRCVERAAHDSGSASLRVSRFLFHALRRDVFAALFFAITLSGERAAIPIAVAFGALITAATWLLHGPRLVAAAQALRAAHAGSG